MVRARPALMLLFAAALLLGAVGTARSDTGAPTGLHAFLLRVDEPAQTQFSRTPAFAWTPVPGALHYEFQLSLSGTFRDNSVIYADQSVPTPVLAPDITLPWITGNPHSLYARVRAVTTTGATAWSAGYGFDMVPPAPPTPLPSYPGVLRWTPIEGAPAYEIWLVDAKKFEITTTNVLDEREFFTFHETPGWTSSIRWRIRVLRTDNSVSGRLNTIPAVKYGPWSTTYNSTNPAFAGGTLKLVGTLSDVFSDGSANSPSHRLMPAFLWTGNTGLDGKPDELFRVEVFTDKQCLNRVFTGAVTGAQAYAPRPFGPLAMPTSAAGIVAARNAYLSDGAEPAGLTPDGDSIKPTEMSPDATPTGTAPGDPGTPAGGTDTGSGSSGSSGSSSAAAPGSAGTLTWQGRPGAPVDLWDVEWPDSGYYWTVIPVSATPPDALSTAVVAPGAKVGDAAVPVANSQGFQTGDIVQVGAGPSAETVTVTGVSDGSLTLSAALKFGHGSGESVVRVSGNFQYRDLELAQDACASGRIARFGKSSEPSLTASGDEFITGLSSTGRLTSARQTTAFYGQPLISWTPALGATAYEVQWSKTRYPFTSVGYNGKAGYLTTATSLVLPVGPGTYYYRVRGYDYSLPTGSQQMSWSDPAKIVVAKPQFKVVGGTTKLPAKKTTAPRKKTAPKTSTGMKRIVGNGLTFTIPTGWTLGKDNGLPVYRDAAKTLEVTALMFSSDYATQAANMVANYAKNSIQASTTSTTLPAGRAEVVTAKRIDSNGAQWTDVTYVVASGTGSRALVFSAKGSAYASNASLFAKIAASLKLGG